MKVAKLFIKQKPHRGVSECETLLLRRGFGIVGDANAAIGSPCQVLFAGVPTLKQFDLKPGQLQENILLDTAVEDFTSGQTLQLGPDALVRLTFLCEPCATIEKIQPGLVKRIKGKRGMLGIVVRDGQVSMGDEVAIAPPRFSPLPETTRGKFEEFVFRIPSGKVVKTSELLLALGLPKSYYRTIPMFLKKALADLPVHRIVAIDGRLMTQHLPHQHQALLEEGVEVVNERVPSRYCWEPIHFHDLDPLSSRF